MRTTRNTEMSHWFQLDDAWQHGLSNTTPPAFSSIRGRLEHFLMNGSGNICTSWSAMLANDNQTNLSTQRHERIIENTRNAKCQAWPWPWQRSLTRGQPKSAASIATGKDTTNTQEVNQVGPNLCSLSRTRNCGFIPTFTTHHNCTRVSDWNDLQPMPWTFATAWCVLQKCRRTRSESALFRANYINSKYICLHQPPKTLK